MTPPEAIVFDFGDHGLQPTKNMSTFELHNSLVHY